MDEFSLLKQEGIFDEYIGKYVLIYTPMGTTFGGKLTGVKEGYFILNPHQSGSYGPEGLVRVMIRKNSKVPIYHAAIEPNTEESLEQACKFHNTQSKD